MIRGNLMAPIFREYHFTKVPAAGAVPKPKVTVCAYIERNPGKLSHGQDEKLKFSKKTYWAGNSAVTLRNLVVQPS